MHIRTKSKESLKALYSAFEAAVRRMEKEVQEQFKANKAQTQKSI